MTQNSSIDFIRPESSYSLDSNMSLEKIKRSKDNDDFLVGMVLMWRDSEQNFLVDMGNSITAVMPIEEASIYPTLRRDGIPTPEAYTLISKIVCVRVKSFSDEIIVSRRENMIKAFETLSVKKGEVVEAFIKTSCKTAHYLDVGHGIAGMLHVSNLCKSRLEHICDLQISPDIKVKITNVDSEKLRVTLSYKDLFEDLSGSYQPGDLINVVVLQQLNEDGYFVYVSPNTTAIISSPEYVALPYGSKVIARVRSSVPERLRLKFVSFA